MTRTVDVVIVGADAAAIAATVDAIRKGLRVLVVVRSRRPEVASLLRQVIGAAAVPSSRQLTVMTGAEVVCADGVKSIEAIVVRRVRTRRLVGVNASALLVFEKGERDHRLR